MCQSNLQHELQSFVASALELLVFCILFVLYIAFQWHKLAHRQVLDSKLCSMAIYPLCHGLEKHLFSIVKEQEAQLQIVWTNWNLVGGLALCPSRSPLEIFGKHSFPQLSGAPPPMELHLAEHAMELTDPIEQAPKRFSLQRVEDSQRRVHRRKNWAKRRVGPKQSSWCSRSTVPKFRIQCLVLATPSCRRCGLEGTGALMYTLDISQRSEAFLIHVWVSPCRLLPRNCGQHFFKTRSS